MGWVYLLIAGIFEIGWPLGMKLSQSGNNKIYWIIFSVITMAISGFFLWLSQKYIPMGTAYAVWTGIGAVGTFIIGIVFFKDSLSFFKLLSFSLIVIGLIGLKLSS